MGRLVAIMNAKGGVGKSTVTLMLGEFLAVEKRKTVLLVDADPQSSLSLMVMTPDRWQASVMDKTTISDLLSYWEHQTGVVSHASYLASGVSNIDTQDRMHLLPGSIDLSYVERHVDGRGRPHIERTTRELATFCRNGFDFTLIDCQPSVTYFTELWLQFADYHLVPCRCDFPSFNGIQIVDKVINRIITSPQGFSGEMSRRLGIVLNMKSRFGGGGGTKYENKWEDEIRKVSGRDCFESIIHANRVYAQLNNLVEEDEWHHEAHDPKPVGFRTKYPQDQRKEVEAVVDEFLAAIAKKESA